MNVAAKKRKAGRPSRREDCVGPTPETAAKLRGDPLEALLSRYEDAALERAADEIRAVYLAVCGMLMAGIGGMGGGRREIKPFLAWAHAQTYLPWANSLKRQTLEAVIDLVVDRRSLHPDAAISAAAALTDYALRMRSRPDCEET